MQSNEETTTPLDGAIPSTEKASEQARARLTLRLLSQRRVSLCFVRSDVTQRRVSAPHARTRAPRAPTKFSLTPGFGRSFQVTTPTKLAEDSPEDKYKAMIVTPDGTIIRIGGPEMKPETDPGWEERQAQRKAKRAREETPSSSSDSPAESPLGKALSSPVARGSPWDNEVDDANGM
jgi:hypothetical protein